MTFIIMLRLRQNMHKVFHYSYKTLTIELMKSLQINTAYNFHLKGGFGALNFLTPFILADEIKIVSICRQQS